MEESGRKRVIVIMAGGSGERFWPVSNRETPKQLLRLHGDKTMLEQAFDRAAGLVGKENVYVVAGEHLRKAILNNLKQFAPENYISEPIARNTAACLGLAACHLADVHGPETTMGVLTADHVIEEGKKFSDVVETAFAHAERGPDLLTIGIQPTHADTAFGYLELGSEVEGEALACPVFRVQRFTEKPDQKTAEEFVAQDNYAWNSGMFFWRVKNLLAEFDKHQPEMAAQWKRLGEKKAPYDLDFLTDVFEALPKKPIDTAIMERTDHVAGIKGTFGWDDVGSWDALARVRETDSADNCSIGSVQVLESKRNIVYNEVSENEAPEIVLEGVEDMVVVRTDKAILITPKSRVQNVKKIVQHLKETNRDDLL